ncbi:MAG TPA: hypothetical protein VNT58_09215 [Gaiellaceae bacterium]|nr:hypothetical protein [Gaiellaceae bacterium]
MRGRALAVGLAAGAAGTALMTAWQEVAQRARRGGDADDGATDPAWEDAPAPAQVARRLLAPLRIDPPPTWIQPLTHAMHWGYGTAWGVGYAVAAGGSRSDALRRGLALGTAVWAASYAQLVPLGIYEPPWRYPPNELALDLSYHLVYGVGVAGAHAALA